MNYGDFNVNQVRQKLPQNEFYNRRLTHLKVSTTPGEPLGLDSGKKHRWDEPEVPRFSFSGTAKSHIGSFQLARLCRSSIFEKVPLSLSDRHLKSKCSSSLGLSWESN